ncbi:FGGY-family carbohydrate kinase [Pseudorhodobacter sp.]|uniref:FGGY-family carbohydrate kinase n=1 Tax=Pseudorhodobacter sp. TaxID=1934400 RepID=UPI0026476A2C|nr:FGGY-family carbohydrate kinase [Pseudorhodobacter sp.]MDN5786922.1 hypothetical protein [Pseudorhodobacter sp.]
MTEAAAKATGLHAGTPVIAGYFDVVSSAMGSGVVSADEASIIVGTWSINQVFSNRPVSDAAVFMVAGFGKDRFVNIESSATSAANLEWYVRNFVERGAPHDDPFGHCNAALASVAPRLDDPFFHPFLYGSRLSSDHRAGFFDPTGWHGEDHMLRALFEGVMFEHKRHILVLQRAGVDFDRAVLSGGGACSPHWPQMFADCLGVPITVAQAQETGALGAAIGAGVGIGAFSSYEEAIVVMTRARQEYMSNPERADFYAKRYAAWRHLSTRLEGFGKDLQVES